MLHRIGQALTLLSVAVTVFSILYFAAAALGREEIADYIRNHFVREIVFGLTLCAATAWLALRRPAGGGIGLLALLGGLLVAPFWIGVAAGIGNREIAAIWGDLAGPSDSFALHTVQAALMLLGVALMAAGRRRY